MRILIACESSGITRDALLTPEQIASRLGCTVAQLKTQYAKNAADLRAMQTQAEAAGKKVRGFSASELADKAFKMEELSK